MWYVTYRIQSDQIKLEFKKIEKFYFKIKISVYSNQPNK